MGSKKITVLQMLPALESGGVERGTLELSRYLSNRGHRSLVISSGGRMVEQLESDGGVHLSWKHIGEKSPRCLKYILKLRHLIDKEKVDILHIRSRIPAWIGYLAWKSLPKGRRPTLVSTFHGYYSINPYSAVMTKGEHVIAISGQIKEHMMNNYNVPEDKITLIHRCVDDEYFNPDKIAESRINKLKNSMGINNIPSPVILLPGRVTRLKGHDVFIKALAPLKDIPWTAICAGDADKNSSYVREIFQSLKNSGMEDRIKFVGNCSDMAAMYEISDIVVSASSTEPEAFGRIAIEGQVMKKAVIATAHGGSLETVLDNKTGLLVKPGDAESMSRALKILLTDKNKREELGINGRKWVLSNFTIDQMCQKTVDLYQHSLMKRM